MADSDYTVAVVLQASDEGMSSTLKGAADGIEDVGDKSKQTKIDTMATVVALEGLTSGLNQLTGGARKYSAALVQTNRISKEQGEELNKQIAYMELVTGPMESIIALQKIATTTTALFTTAEVADNSVKTTSISLNWALAGSIWAVVAPLLVIIAILAVFYLAWKHQEFIIDNATKALGGFKDIVVGLGKEGMKVVDTLEDMARGLANIAGTVTLGIIPGFGGD
tara:strand:- start:4 stop:675 length:672 start_codon:yes stop_codon:yes gene_type:complete